MQVVDKGNTSFILSIIEPQFNGGNDVLFYYINITSDTQMETWHLSKTGKETLCVVRGLSPNTSYAISVVAVNIIGEGPPFIINSRTDGCSFSFRARLITDLCF